MKNSRLSSFEHVAVEIEAEAVELSLEHAMPIGLLINELVSNCYKHAFPDRQEGIIRISLQYVTPNLIELVIADNGVGMPGDFDPEASSSLGMKLVNILSTGQLKGQFDVEQGDGTLFRIRFAPC